MHTSHQELEEKIKQAALKVKVGGIYYHWRNPSQHYKVIELGFCEWDETLVVVYQQVGNPQPLT